MYELELRSTEMPKPINLFEYERKAQDKIESGHYDFIAGGATDEITIKRTRAVLDSIMIRPSMLVDVSRRDLTTTVLGHDIAMPVMLDPAGNHSSAHPEAELATAKAAGDSGTVMIVSSHASRTLEEVASVATGPLWFQQYFFEDRGLTLEMAARAEDSGYSAICITLDAKISPKRERNIRNKYIGPPSPNYAHLDLGQDGRNFTADAPSGPTDIRSVSADWSELEWFVSNSHLPVIVKGIMKGQDGKLAEEHGAAAIIVSNHGGRYLDTTPTTIEVLPEIVRAINGSTELYLDGGIRRGTDIYKAIALGAKCVLIGRPLFWGLAVDGKAGLMSVLEILYDELDSAMGMCGSPNIDSINADNIDLVSPLLSSLPTSLISKSLL